MDPKRSRLDHYLEWASALILLGCAVLALCFAVKTARLPMQFDFGEGDILNAGLRITQGLTPYPDPHGWPSILNPYGPIPYLLTALLVKWFGVSFFAPRLVSVLCGAAIAFLIGAIIRRLGGSWAIGILLGCVFLSLSSIRNWMLTCRVDWLAVALTLGGLAAFIFWERRWYVAALLFSAALLVKYSVVAAPLACGLVLINRREWKLFFRLAGGSVGICLVAFFLTQRWSDGNFAFHEFRTHPDPYSWTQTFEFMGRRLKDMPIVFGIAVAHAGAEAWRKRLTLPSLYFLAATACALTVGKAGATSNHLIEWTAAACIGAGCGWRPVAQWLAEKRWKIAGYAALTGVFAMAVLAVALYRLPFEERTMCAPTYNFLRKHGDNVLTDSVGALLLTGKPVLVSDLFIYTQLVTRSGWSDAPVRDRVARKEFDVILLRERIGVYRPNDRFTVETLRAMGQNYHEAEAFECYDSGYAYLPNP
jgi:hypothetical protein